MSGESVAALTRALDRARGSIEAGDKEWERQRAALTDEIARLTQMREVALQGVDADEQAAAEKIVRVRGRISESAGGAFDAAVAALALGGGDMDIQYIGAKRFDGFHQRCDCRYGYGPRHGSIVFAVELTPEARQRVKARTLLTEVERDTAIRYLHARKAAEASSQGKDGQA